MSIDNEASLAVFGYQSVKATSAKPRITGVFRDILRCCRGVAALEFAFAAPVVVAIAAGIFELAMVMFVSTLAEGGLREASRFSITGFVPSGTTREDRILQILKDHTIGLVDVDAATITFRVYPSFGDIGKPEPFTDTSPANGSYDAGEAYQDINGNGQWDADMGAAGLGGPGEVVLYTIAFDWALLTPLVSPFMGTDGKLRLTSSVAVRNEPFDPLGAAAGAGG
jgi:Flp pilus assembly protein TadG